MLVFGEALLREPTFGDVFGGTDVSGDVPAFRTYDGRLCVNPTSFARRSTEPEFGIKCLALSDTIPPGGTNALGIFRVNGLLPAFA